MLATVGRVAPVKTLDNVAGSGHSKQRPHTLAQQRVSALRQRRAPAVAMWTDAKLWTNAAGWANGIVGCVPRAAMLRWIVVMTACRELWRLPYSYVLWEQTSSRCRVCFIGGLIIGMHHIHHQQRPNIDAS